MPGTSFKLGRYKVYLDFVGDYKPGDPAPSGYLDWHEWARIQHKAGLRQRRCAGCNRYLYPQEIEGHKCEQVKPSTQ